MYCFFFSRYFYVCLALPFSCIRINNFSSSRIRRKDTTHLTYRHIYCIHLFRCYIRISYDLSKYLSNKFYTKSSQYITKRREISLSCCAKIMGCTIIMPPNVIYFLVCMSVYLCIRNGRCLTIQRKFGMMRIYFVQVLSKMMCVKWSFFSQRTNRSNKDMTLLYQILVLFILFAKLMQH